MSKINELIQQLCPNGVEFKQMWEVTSWDKKFNSVDKVKQPKVFKFKYYLASELKPLIIENGDVKILTTNNTNIFTSKELINNEYYNAEIIAIPWGGNPIVQYFNGDFITSDNRIAISNDTNILATKFLYYYLLDNLKILASFYRGAGIKHPNMAKVLDLYIPIPPIQVQQEIVKILDQFTALEQELNNELQARKQQYSFYQKQLLSFEGKEIVFKALGEVCELKAGKSITSTKISNLRTDNQNYVCIGGNGIRGYVSDFSHSGEFPIIGRQGALCGNLYFAQGDFYATEHAVVVKPILNQNKKFLYYLLKYLNLNQYATGGAQPGLAVSNLNKLRIPIPSLEEQERIVKILDQFDALVNDTTYGLPAEINARKQQYEYYRNQLLTFKPLD